MYRRFNRSLRWGLPLFFVWAGVTCSAQVRRYQPRTPTVSPYNNLVGVNNSALPNYYAFVRPKFNQRAINRQEQALRQQQAGSLRRLQNDVQLGLQPAAPTGTGSWFMTPGSRSTYLDSSSYYPRAILRNRR
jgi:hypothetical protein